MRTLILVALLAAVTTAAAKADVGPPWGPASPNFNLEAVLRPVAEGAGGFGLVKFRQPKDADRIVYLDTWVRDLAPGSYSLQRATDTNLLEEGCSGTNWLTLGAGPASQPIVTDDRGTGRADLWRNLSVFPVGAEFDIHFRVIDAAGAVVLQSGCYRFTVNQ